jgi:hypothetical protein
LINPKPPETTEPVGYAYGEHHPTIQPKTLCTFQ